MIELTQEQIDFIEDFASIPFDQGYFFAVYGEDKVRLWISSPDIAACINRRKHEIKREKAKQQELMIENWGMLKNKAFEGLVVILSDKDHPEYGRTVRWLMSGEHSYISKRAETLGIKDAQGPVTKREPLTILRGDGDKETT